MRTITDTERLTEMEDYENKSWVKHQGARVLKPNGTSTPTDFVWSYVERRDALNYTGNPVWTGKQHLMSNSVPQRKIDDTDWQGVDWLVTGVNGAQQPTIMIRYLNGGGVSDVRTWQEFSYDNGMRMTDQKYLYALNGAGLSAPTFTLSNQVYNYKDQLIEKNIGYRGVNNTLQSIDYQYNTRGWLTGINTVGLSGGASSLLTPSMQGTGGITNLAITPFLNAAFQQQVMEALPPMTDTNVDLFSQTLTYETPDNRTGAASQKNGNISSTVWQVAGRDRQAYGFKYDDLNRLTEATYYDIIGTQSTVSTDNKFSEKQTYDLRGNITTLKRNGLNGGSWTSNGYTAGTYGLIDDLTYTYGTGNQLTKVRDISLLDKGFKSVNNPNSTHYTYDANGNLKSDLNKGILLIEYNVLNLPQVITFTNNRQLQWVYDASGAKLRKMVLENGSVKETRDYVNGVEYKNRLLERVSHSEGAVVLNEYGNDQHEYVLRDHLGNTRVTFRDGTNKGHFFDWNTWSYKNLDPNYDDGIVTKDDIVQINNYYPFGLNMEGDWNGASGNNKYQYNGKEWNDDFGLGWNDYGARFYDPAIARWTAVDPLSEKMRRHSPYNYAFDNPMRFIDPDGMAPAEGPGCGKVIAVFYHGGPDGGGKTTTSDKAGVAGNIYNSTEAIAGSSNREFAGTIIAPGLTSASGVQNGFDFITQNYQEGDQVIIYGYSYGTDVAVDLSTKLQDACIPVNLLVTVDGSDGPLQNSTVNTSIPENVSTNLNVYQTHDSGTSSKVVKSDSGTSNSPGSNGGANTAIDSKQTTVINKNVTAPGTTHGNIQTKAQGTIESKIKEKIQAY